MSDNALIRVSNEVGLVTDTLDGMFEIARLFRDGGLLPKNTTDAQAVCAMIAGRRVGLSYDQAVQGIQPINGRPTLWGDHALGVVLASGMLEDISETIERKGDDVVATCSVTRRGMSPHTQTFAVTQAKTAGLWGKAGPWTTAPRRMLAMRARAFALRDRFADVLRGIGIAEEVRDEPSQIVVSATPARDTLALPLDPIRRADHRERDRVRQEVAAVVEPPRPAEAARDSDDDEDEWDSVDPLAAVTEFDELGLPL